MAPSIPSCLNVNKPIVTYPICATEEYAINFFISFCIKATNDAYIIAMTPSIKTNGA